MIVGFIFVCTDIEYNLNQQIARGYISREAAFFEIDNPSYKTDIIGESYFWDDGTSEHHVTDGADVIISDTGEMQINSSYIEAKDPTFVLTNKTNNSGLTSVEEMLSSGDTDYFAALHSGVLRGVYYQGNIELPPLLSGNFFTSEECLNKTPFAVVGKLYTKYIYKEDGKKYFDYHNRKYEVIGITGLSGDSALDSMIFVNLGSLTPEEQISGIYYIDSSSDNKMLYHDFEAQAEELFGCSIKEHDIPSALIDTVSGGMYLKMYLKYIMLGLLLFTFVNILIQSLRTSRSKISILKVLGISNSKILISVSLQYSFEILCGIFIGLLTISLIIITGLFSLPISTLIDLALKLTGISVLMLVFWIIASEAVIILINPREVIQKI